MYRGPPMKSNHALLNAINTLTGMMAELKMTLSLVDTLPPQRRKDRLASLEGEHAAIAAATDVVAALSQSSPDPKPFSFPVVLN